MNQAEMLPALQSYFNLMTYNGAAFVFQLSQMSGLVRVLASGPKTLPQICELSQMQPEPCRLLLDCLVGMDLLKSQDGNYVPAMTMGFLAGPYQNLGQEYWNHLPQFLKTAEPLKQMDNPVESEKEYQRQVESLDWMMRPSAMLAAQQLIAKHGKGCKVLDLGAGSGVWSTQLLQQDQSATATLVDWAGVLEIAKKSAAQLGIGERVSYQPGNYHELSSFGESYDMVFIGNVTHIESPAGVQDLLKKSYAALKPGGEVVIFDVFATQEAGKLPAALYAMGLALRTKSGRLWQRHELERVMQENKLNALEFCELKVAPFTMAMLKGKKI